VLLGFAAYATLLVDAGQRAYNASVCRLAGMIFVVFLATGEQQVNTTWHLALRG
jgi:hypothetical protein